MWRVDRRTDLNQFRRRFTVEAGRLFILQTRSAKRTSTAAVKTAVDMAGEGLISREEAIRQVDPEDIVQLLVPRFKISQRF